MACDTCHRRKVRCVSESSATCANCRLAGAECTYRLAAQYRIRRRRPRSFRPSSAFPRSSGSRLFERRANVTPTRPVLGHEVSSSLLPPDAYDTFSQALAASDEDMVEEKLSRTALTRFHQLGIHADRWSSSVFDDGRYIRIAYVGTSTSNLAHLVQEEVTAQDKPYSATLHYLFPSIRPTMPWKPHGGLPMIKWYSKVTEEVSALPPADIRDSLVEAFFNDIHPGYPIVDEAQFRHKYSDPRDPPPLLLLQSILLAGAHVCPHAKVAESRSLVKLALFRRAKALFDMHFENDRMVLVQAALLFAWHFEGADDVSSNVYYWAGVACRIAFGLGLHRDIGQSASTRMPRGDCRIYRRIWWTLYQVDVLASLHQGRPSMIDPDECDQTPLVEEDFIEYCGRKNENVNIDYCKHNARICSIITSIMKLSSPGSSRRHRASPGSLEASKAAIDSELAIWYLELPKSLLDFSSQALSFWPLQLQAHYNLALIHLHRVHDEDYPESPHSESAKTRHTAAISMAKTFDDMIAAQCIHRCWFTSLTALLAAAIQMTFEARTAAARGSTILGLQAQSTMSNLLTTINAIALYWPSAEAIYSIFRDLSVNLRSQTKATLNKPVDVSSFGTEMSVSQSEQSLGLSPRYSHVASPVLRGREVDSSPEASHWRDIFGAGEGIDMLEMNDTGLDEWLALSLDSLIQ